MAQVSDELRVKVFAAAEASRIPAEEPASVLPTAGSSPPF